LDSPLAILTINKGRIPHTLATKKLLQRIHTLSRRGGFTAFHANFFLFPKCTSSTSCLLGRLFYLSGNEVKRSFLSK